MHSVIKRNRIKLKDEKQKNKKIKANKKKNQKYLK